MHFSLHSPDEFLLKLSTSSRSNIMNNEMYIQFIWTTNDDEKVNSFNHSFCTIRCIWLWNDRQQTSTFSSRQFLQWRLINTRIVSRLYFHQEYQVVSPSFERINLMSESFHISIGFYSNGIDSRSCSIDRYSNDKLGESNLATTSAMMFIEHSTSPECIYPI